MLATLVLTMVHVAPLQESAPAKQDSAAILDQLIERSRAVKSFSATYRMTKSDHDGSAKIRLDYRAPEDLRMDLESEDGQFSTWMLGDVFEARGKSDGKASDVRVDTGQIRAELAPIEAELDRNFPTVKSPGRRRGGVAMITWSINRSTNKLDYDMSINTFDDAETVCGWLETIKKKQVDLVEDGDRLCCTTDEGRVDVVLSKTSGFLEKLLLRKPESTSTMTIALESLVLDQPVDAARFEIPPLSSEGQRASAEQLKPMTLSARVALRSRIWIRATSTCSDADVEPRLRSKFEATLKPLLELTCQTRYDPWLATLRKNIEQIADYVRQLDEAGRSDDDLEKARESWTTKVTAMFDEAESGLVSKLEIPASAASASCAPQLLTIERELTASVFRELVRKPILDEFDEATKTD